MKLLSLSISTFPFLPWDGFSVGFSAASWNVINLALTLLWHYGVKIQEKTNQEDKKIPDSTRVAHPWGPGGVAGDMGSAQEAVSFSSTPICAADTGCKHGRKHRNIWGVSTTGPGNGTASPCPCWELRDGLGLAATPLLWPCAFLTGLGATCQMKGFAGSEYLSLPKVSTGILPQKWILLWVCACAFCCSGALSWDQWVGVTQIICVENYQRCPAVRNK